MAVPYSRFIIGGIPWYSVLIVAGILLAYGLGSREESRLGLPKDTMLDMTLVAVPCGIVGARLYYVLMELDQFADNPISALYIWEGGIAIYGAVLGGALGVFVYARRKKLSFAAMLDMVAPGLVLAQAIGRWGNYFNQEAYGPVISNAAWQFFPAGVLIGDTWHVATFFYESVWDLGCFLLLMALRKRVFRHGDLFLWYVIAYGSGRYLVEQLRMDSLYIGAFRASQYLSLALCALAAALLLWRCFHAHRASLPLMAALCLLAFVRPLVSAQGAGAWVTLTLYGVCLLLLVWYQGKRRLPLCLLLADAAVYIVLLATGREAWWQSPYFLYVAVTIPLYLSIPYRETRPTNA